MSRPQLAADFAIMNRPQLAPIVRVAKRHRDPSAVLVRFEIATGVVEHAPHAPAAPPTEAELRAEPVGKPTNGHPCHLPDDHPRHIAWAAKLAEAQRNRKRTFGKCRCTCNVVFERSSGNQRSCPDCIKVALLNRVYKQRQPTKYKTAKACRCCSRMFFLSSPTQRDCADCTVSIPVELRRFPGRRASLMARRATRAA